MTKDKLKALLTLAGISQKEMADMKGISRQQLNNKLSAGAYKLNELIELAEITKTQLAFIDKNGKPVITFDSNDLKAE